MRQYRNIRSFVLHRRESDGCNTVRTARLVVCLSVFFAASSPMPHRCASTSGSSFGIATVNTAQNCCHTGISGPLSTVIETMLGWMAESCRLREVNQYCRLPHCCIYSNYMKENTNRKGNVAQSARSSPQYPFGLEQ